MLRFTKLGNIKEEASVKQGSLMPPNNIADNRSYSEHKNISEDAFIQTINQNMICDCL